MKVLALFDGMSCGQLALKKLGVKVDKYYASEIDKYAIQITQKNFPNTIQVGDVCNLDPNDFKDVDLILCGSPCQGFSFAGKQLAFDDPRSALFFEFIRLLKAIKPKYFLLENVRMKKEFLEVITEQVSKCYPDFSNGKDMFGSRIEPILINSSLLSAQSRQRFYWTNIPNIEQPKDKGIVLRDILEQDVDDSHKLSEAKKDRVLHSERGKGFFYEESDEKIGTLVAGYHKQPTDGSYIKQHKAVKKTERNRRHLRQLDEKSLCMTATMWKGAGNNGMTLVPQKPIKVGMNVEKVKIRVHEVNISGLQHLLREMKKQSRKTNKQISDELNVPITKVEHFFRTDKYFAIPSDDIWFDLKKCLGIETDVFDREIMEFEYRDGVFESTQRVYSDQGKSPTLTASNKEQMIETKPKQVGIASDVNGHDILKRVYSANGKSPTLNTMGGGNREPKVSVQSYREVRTEEAKEMRKMVREKTGKDFTPFRAKKLVPRDDNKVGTLTPNLNNQHNITEDYTWRKLTPLECERLQTVPDNYTEGVSNTQRYKMLGNGWTVDVIAHILKNMDL